MIKESTRQSRQLFYDKFVVLIGSPSHRRRLFSLRVRCRFVVPDLQLQAWIGGLFSPYLWCHRRVGGALTLVTKIQANEGCGV
jgi:hypothetical protein